MSLERESRVQGLTWVFQRDLGELSIDDAVLVGRATTSVNEFTDWIRVEGGIDVDASFIELRVTGQRQAGVAITNMSVKVKERGAPLRGTFFYAPPQGERENAQIGFNLDERGPVARLVEPNSNLGDRDYLGQDYFKTHDVQLDLGEVQEFTVVAMTSSYYYAWQIEMEVEAGGRKNYVTIGLDGDKKPDPTPFKISARADSRSNRRGSFAVYKELYVLDDTTNRAGFTTVDPRTFAP